MKTPAEVLINHHLNPTDLWMVAAMKEYATQWIDEATVRAVNLSDKYPESAIVVNDLLYIRDEIISAIKNLFMKKPKLTGREINMWEHTGWGNAIHWDDFGKRKIYGHLHDRPKVGDIINAKMKSGKIAQFLVIEVDYMRDPPDMFFCNVSDIGYKE